MKNALILSTGLILLPFSAQAAAPAEMHTCMLLTANEVSAAIGGRAGSSQEDNIVIPNGPAKGDIMGMCMWRAGAGGMVSVNMVHALQSAQREAGFAKLEENFAKLKAQGWTQETK